MTERLTDEQLAEIRERCDAATPGPWGVASYIESPVVVAQLSHFPDEGYLSVTAEFPAVRWTKVREDAAFIAQARADVPALLDEIAVLKAELRRADEECDDLEAALFRERGLTD